MNRYVLALLAMALVFPAMAIAATNSTHDPVPLHRHHSQSVATYEPTIPTHAVVVNQFRRKRISELQTGVLHYRAVARHRAIKLGVNIDPKPMQRNIGWLLWQRSMWKSQAKHYADQLRAVAAQQAAAAAAAASTTTAPTTSVPTSSGFPASCVAIAEESGHNSIAGYFGTISPPSAYNVPATSMVSQYGESWLNWPYSAQLVFSEQLFAEYGGSAWGPLTRQKCGI